MSWAAWSVNTLPVTLYRVTWNINKILKWVYFLEKLHLKVMSFKYKFHYVLGHPVVTTSYLICNARRAFVLLVLCTVWWTEKNTHLISLRSQTSAGGWDWPGSLWWPDCTQLNLALEHNQWSHLPLSLDALTSLSSCHLEALYLQLWWESLDLSSTYW